MVNSPKLVVDAKALYDLLVRPEVQANSGTDKRTTIEVLVTQDKLQCCGALTMWVSSEHQYSDGLTKQSAGQLLADRMRTHMVRLKSDDTFQAAKRKDPKERKKNAEMYATKKPGRAMTAMFASCMMAACAAEEIDIQFAEIGIETDLHMCDVVELYDHLALEQEYMTLTENLAETHVTRLAHEREIEALQRDHARVNHCRTQRPIYFTDSGRCWHANYFCLRNTASTRIHQKEFCSRCANELGEALPPEDWERTL
eukprot:s683_g3.t1